MIDIKAAKPFYSVLILAFACSALVAGAAIGLRPKQEANRQMDRQKNILFAAGLYQENRSIEELFTNIETKIVDLESGQFIDGKSINPKTYNQRRAAFSKEMGRPLTSDIDLAKLGRQEKYSLVYLVKESEDSKKLSQIILPVRGKGLWSTMYAYIAIDGDLNTIRGVSFYEHGETPGLGGEIENRKWQDMWTGKKLFSDNTIAVKVAKGSPAPDSPEALYHIDSISGATLTSIGVSDMLSFWFGDYGFKPFLTELRKSVEKGDTNNG